MERTRNIAVKPLNDGRRGLWPVWLAIAYIVLCAVRFGLAYISTLYPTTIPDEFLYYSMARSLGTGNGALIYGQKANYSYFLYPGMLSAVYALFGEGANFYRLMQLESILVMNLSIFPIFALSRRLIQSGQKAFWISVLALLMPDFILSARLLSESLLYPIFFLMMLFVWDGLESGQDSRFIPVGALGGLLYGIKPGQIVTPLVAIVLMAAFGFRENRKRALEDASGGILSLGAVCALLYGINRLFINPGTSAFSVYENQIGLKEAMSVGAFLKGTALSPFVFLLGGGVVLVALPLLQIREYGARKRMFLAISLASAAILMLGTAWVVNRIEYNDPTVHARYIAMFFPVLLILMNSDVDSREPEIDGIDIYPASLLYALIGYAAFCTAAFGFDGALSANSNNAAQYSLSLLTRAAISYPGSLVAGVIVVAAVAGLALLSAKGGKHRAGIATAVAAALIVANNASAYPLMRESVYQPIADAGRDIYEAAMGEDYLYVFSKSTSRYDAYLDVNTQKNVSMIYVNDLFNHMIENLGVYAPFVPGTVRGDIPDRQTADAELILVDRDVRTQIHLSPSATVVAETPYLTLIRVQRGERWLDSMAGGMVNKTLSVGSNAYFAIFEEAPAYSTLKIDLELSADTKIRINSEKAGTFEFTLPAGRDSYEIGFPTGDRLVCLSSPEADIVIHGYEFM